MTELPLARTGCALDSDGAERQAERYAAVGAALTSIERDELRLVARFGDELDEALLQETIDVERSCCSFFAITFDPAERRLELAVPGAEQAPVLDLVHDALTRMGAWDGSTSST